MSKTKAKFPNAGVVASCGTPTQDPKLGQGDDEPLKIFGKAIDDIRSLVACKICTKPMFEPYTTSCGHSYCYSCLLQWFSSHRQKKTCPGCRSKIAQRPVPDYTIRNIVQVLISHPAFLEEGDTMERLRQDQKDEARLVERDKSSKLQKGGALFRGCFNDVPSISIYDSSDGVHRCPYCTWELEDEYCDRCGREVDFDSDADAHLTFSEDEAEDAQDAENLRGLYNAIGHRLTAGFGVQLTPPFYPPERTPPYYESDQNERGSTSTEDSETRQVRQEALSSGHGSTSSTVRDSVFTWSETDTDSEGYTRTTRSVHGPITWANHPNFARRASGRASVDGNDTEADDFIDDGSIDISSSGMEQVGEEEVTADQASIESDEEFPIATRRRPILGESTDEDTETEGQADDNPHEVGNPGIVMTNKDEQSVSSSESGRPVSHQQRKRRRMILSDSDEEDAISSRLDRRPRLRRRLTNQNAVLPERVGQLRSARVGLGSCSTVEAFEPSPTCTQSVDRSTFHALAEESFDCVPSRTLARRRRFSFTPQPLSVISLYPPPNFSLRSRRSNRSNDETFIGSRALLP